MKKINIFFMRCGVNAAAGRFQRPWFGFHRQTQRVSRADGLCPSEKQQGCFSRCLTILQGGAP
ncbi:hypothetical protein D3Z39_00235 [Anaerotruncus colihominis]|uniref:Uncharacterized protein n=1 Tax=Anaerotruncus colihominis TaxID=169435 RepID=A0A845RAS9_9FIRM|nr:hypothetical protein [Anaerotruncus colihominis]